jgi:hypothetical protein
VKQYFSCSFRFSSEAPRLKTMNSEYSLHLQINVIDTFRWYFLVQNKKYLQIQGSHTLSGPLKGKIICLQNHSFKQESMLDVRGYPWGQGKGECLTPTLGQIGIPNEEFIEMGIFAKKYRSSSCSRTGPL